MSEKKNRGGPYKTTPATDLSRWRLTNTNGRQTWQYYPEGEEPGRPQNFVEKFSLGLDIVRFFVLLFVFIADMYQSSQDRKLLCLIPDSQYL